MSDVSHFLGHANGAACSQNRCVKNYLSLVRNKSDTGHMEGYDGKRMRAYKAGQIPRSETHDT
jgi:hypothetical protein